MQCSKKQPMKSKGTAVTPNPQVTKQPALAEEAPREVDFQCLAAVAEAIGANSVVPAPGDEGHVALALDDYVTVVVTPKLSFQVVKRPEWRTVDDISQEDLKRGFLSRFPPALWMSSHKFSFKPALAPTSLITEETKCLVFKLVSDEVADERIMLTILRELEKSYEGIIRRAVNETRSEALQEQVLLQEQAEGARREQEKKLGELKKENKSIRDQMQSMQKRLFLVEQEKDQMRKEQQQTKELLKRMSRVQEEHTRELKAQKLESCSQVEALWYQLSMPATAAESVEVAEPAPSGELAKETADASSSPRSALGGDPCDAAATASDGGASQAGGGVAASPSAASGDSGKKHTSKDETDLTITKQDGKDAATTAAVVDCSCQTDPVPEACGLGADEKQEALRQQVARLELQLGALQGWLVQGSSIFRPFQPPLTPGCT
eukprot:TRINITY_DN7898_c0_g1_i1.p1 TRINITY_DN7898_c0_g1~~TRINITY_DN7898_c0_g1_i1.p1  ORF type:complete len:436 (+),score=103.83 TRINITY_DN7898_c0_g1_i1:60-1367(+)